VVLVVAARLARFPLKAGALGCFENGGRIPMTAGVYGLSRLGFGRLETRELLVFEGFPRAQAFSVS